MSKVNNTQYIKVFLGSLPKKTKDRSLLEHLSQYGSVIKVEIKKKQFNNECLGYGNATVTKKTYETLLRIESSSYLGRSITFGPFLDGNRLRSHLNSLNSKRIFVRNIPAASTPSSLIEFFSSLGKVEAAYLRNIPKSRKSIGVVIYSEARTAEQAVEIINKDSNGVFTKMNATYKFVTNYKKRKQSNSSRPGGKNSDKRRKSLSNGTLIQNIPVRREDHIRPGRNGYQGYDEAEKKHGTENLMLNVAIARKRYNQPRRIAYQNEFKGYSNNDASFSERALLNTLRVHRNESEHRWNPQGYSGRFGERY